MMNKLRAKMLVGLMSALAVLATVAASSASACGIGHYQPRVPNSLQR
ncbi:MAG: AgrD family cyclic lactone autoinducer peptide [Solirubrobacterales bacterium]